MSRIAVLMVVLGSTIALEARTYWNGTRYVEVSDSGSVSRRRNSDELENLGVRPESYKDKESFLKDYTDQELNNLTADQRNDDRRTMGGEKARKLRIRRAGERLWREAQKDAAAELSEDDSVAGDEKYLKGDPLYGLFGIQLGSVPSLQDYWRIGDSNTYEFKPAKQFRSYKKYVFSITPITHKIYGIRASDMSFDDVRDEGNQSKIKAEWTATKAALEKRFHKEAKMEIGTLVCPNFKLLFPDKNMKISREISVVFGASIIAVDLDLKKLADEEREILNRRMIETSAENDADAL